MSEKLLEVELDVYLDDTDVEKYEGYVKHGATDRQAWELVIENILGRSDQVVVQGAFLSERS